MKAPAPVVVRSVNTHRAAGLAVLGIGDPSRDPVLAERAVSLVAIQLVGLGIVSLEDVGPAIGVVVKDCDAQRFGRRVVHARPGADIFKRAVPSIPVQHRWLPWIRLGRAVRLGGAVHRAPQVLVRRPLHVVSHQQVQVPV